MADISTASFDNGLAFPAEIAGPILARGLQGSPFFNALTRRETSRSSIVFPTVDPTGFDWVAELGVIPGVDAGDDAVLAVPVKCAGNVLLSNESVSDLEFDLVGGIGEAIARGMGTKVDDGTLYGDGTGATPVGVFAGLDNVSGTTLREAAITGAAEVMGSGGTPNALFVTPAMWGIEMSRETTTGPVFIGTDLTILGLRVIVVPKLHAGDAVVADTTRCYGVVRSDPRIEANRQSDAAWTRDGTQVRVITRVAAVIPDPASAARSLTVTP
jgi:hypothetical protein